MLYVWTAPFDYPGPYRLDVSSRSTCPLAPSSALLEKAYGWVPIADRAFVDSYVAELEQIRKEQPAVWSAFVGAARAVLVERRPPSSVGHRSVLARHLHRIKVAKYQGEIEEWDRTVERPAWAVYIDSRLAVLERIHRTKVRWFAARGLPIPERSR